MILQLKEEKADPPKQQTAGIPFPSPISSGLYPWRILPVSPLGVYCSHLAVYAISSLGAANQLLILAHFLLTIDNYILNPVITLNLT